MKSMLWYLVAAAGEIGGCFAFWAWLRMKKSPLWLLPGLVALVTFALALTRIDADNAGRAYAAYGGVYILSSLAWLWAVEGIRPRPLGYHRCGHLPGGIGHRHSVRASAHRDASLPDSDARRINIEKYDIGVRHL